MRIDRRDMFLWTLAVVSAAIPWLPVFHPASAQQGSFFTCVVLPTLPCIALCGWLFTF